jgi:hypothetical protein
MRFWFEGDKAQPVTVLSVIEAFMQAHRRPWPRTRGAWLPPPIRRRSRTAASRSSLERISDVLYSMTRWRREYLGQEIPDGYVFTQPWSASPRRAAWPGRSKTSPKLQACLDGTPVMIAQMSKPYLQARPVHHRTCDCIGTHLTMVFAALAVSHWTWTTTCWSIKDSVRTGPAAIAPLPSRSPPHHHRG